MGGAKFSEENAERLAESIPLDEQIRVFIPPFRPIKIPEVQKLHLCPLCCESFTTQDYLRTHISKSHGGQHVYFCVNGRIERDYCWLENEVTECEIVLIDVNVRLKLEINDEKTFLDLSRTTSLKKELKKLRPGGSATLSVIDGPFKRSLRIDVGSQANFSSQQMDDELWAFMETGFVSMSKHLQHLRSQLDSLCTNSQECRYADGMTAFCHAVILRTQQSRFSKDRLEEAFSLLAPFETEIAREARSVLAFIMNCFEGDWPSRPTSTIDLAKWFYCAAPKPRKLAASPDPLVIVDDLTHHILEAITRFFAKDYCGLLKLLNDLETRYPQCDGNDYVKLKLLEARAANEIQEVRRATSAYTTLSNHKLFNEEAKKYLNASDPKSPSRKPPR
jgi:hypothetical protein